MRRSSTGWASTTRARRRWPCACSVSGRCRCRSASASASRRSRRVEEAVEDYLTSLAPAPPLRRLRRGQRQLAQHARAALVAGRPGPRRAGRCAGHGSRPAGRLGRPAGADPGQGRPRPVRPGAGGAGRCLSRRGRQRVDRHQHDLGPRCDRTPRPSHGRDRRALRPPPARAGRRSGTPDPRPRRGPAPGDRRRRHRERRRRAADARRRREPGPDLLRPDLPGTGPGPSGRPRSPGHRCHRCHRCHRAVDATELRGAEQQ